MKTLLTSLMPILFTLPAGCLDVDSTDDELRAEELAEELDEDVDNEADGDEIVSPPARHPGHDPVPHGAGLKARICPTHGCGSEPIDDLAIPDDEDDDDDAATG